jgi:hypothetical protein
MFTESLSNRLSSNLAVVAYQRPYTLQYEADWISTDNDPIAGFLEWEIQLTKTEVCFNRLKKSRKPYKIELLT